MATDVRCRGGGCEQNREQLFSLVVERTDFCLDLPVNVRVRRADAVMQGCSLLLVFFFFSIGQVRQSLWELLALCQWGELMPCSFSYSCTFLLRKKYEKMFLSLKFPFKCCFHYMPEIVWFDGLVLLTMKMSTFISHYHPLYWRYCRILAHNKPAGPLHIPFL